MNELHKAILDNDEKLVRTLVRTKPELVFEVGQSGRDSIQLAKASGNIFCLVAILRESSDLIEDVDQYKELLLLYIYELSNVYFCAQWEEGIEKRIWRVTFEDIIDPIIELDPESRLDLKWLASRVNAWPDLSSQDVIVWKSIYQSGA